MPRVRYQNSLGLLSAALGSNPATDTTLTFTSAPSWATLTGNDYIPVVLGPSNSSSPGARFEIVHVTAYTANATTATCIRACEGTSISTHPIGEQWVVATTLGDVPRDQLVNDAIGISSQFLNQLGQSTAVAPSTQRAYGLLHGFFEDEPVTGLAVSVRAAGAGTTPTDIRLFITDINRVIQAVTPNMITTTPVGGNWTVGNSIPACLFTATWLPPANGAYYCFVWENGTWGTTAMTLNAGASNSIVGYPINGKPSQAISSTSATTPTVGNTWPAGSGSASNVTPFWIAPLNS